MNNVTITGDRLQKAQQFFEALLKSTNDTTAVNKEIEGSELNGGESTDNLLSKYTKKLEKAQSEQEEIKKKSDLVAKRCDRYREILKSLSAGEIPANLDEEDQWEENTDMSGDGNGDGNITEEDFKPGAPVDDEDKKAGEVKAVNQTVAPLKNSLGLKKGSESELLLEAVGHLATLVKSNEQKVDELSKQLNKTPGRRSAGTVAALEKGSQTEVLSGAGQQYSLSLQKSQVSTLLMDKFSKTNDNSYAEAVMQFESTGTIPQGTREMLKNENINFVN